jgi:hypothetical protein
MPNFVSKEGVWVPAMEKVAITNKDGEPEIYEGPDREALKMLKEMGNPVGDNGEYVMGQHFTENADMYELARSKHYNSVEEYVEKMGYSKEKAKKIYEDNLKKIVTHKDPERKPDTVASPGGMDQSSGKQIDKGGYGEQGRNLK